MRLIIIGNAKLIIFIKYFVTLLNFEIKLSDKANLSTIRRLSQIWYEAIIALFYNDKTLQYILNVSFEMWGAKLLVDNCLGEESPKVLQVDKR